MKKTLITLFLTGIMLFASVGSGCQKEQIIQKSIFSRPTVERVAGEKKNWLDVDTFSCYYNVFDEGMKKFDVAICEPKYLSLDDIQSLHDAGVWTIAYISIGEDDSLNVADGLGEDGNASYYFYENGAPLKNGNWNSYFVDAGNPVWQERVINRAREILDMGVDGLFLDTVDTVDVQTDFKSWGAPTIGGMVSLIKRLRTTFPQAKLVANRGFSVLEYVSEDIDGLMFESFNTGWHFPTEEEAANGIVGHSRVLTDSEKNYNISIAVNTINKQRQYNYFPVFALDYIDEVDLDFMAPIHYDRSWQYDFIPYVQIGNSLSSLTYLDYFPESQRGELALIGEGEMAQGSGEQNGDTSKNNHAYHKNGVSVAVSSWFSLDYKNNGTAAINDAYSNETMYWARRAWASAEEKPASGKPYTMEHSVTFTFNEAKPLSTVKIYWGFDNGYYSAQEVVIEAWQNGNWVEVARESNIASGTVMSEITFDSVTTTMLRVLQPPGKGASIRPGIMWINEIEIYS